MADKPRSFKRRPAVEEEDGDEIDANLFGEAKIVRATNNYDVISPFGPYMQSSALLIENARDYFFTGFNREKPYASASDPIYSVQVLAQAAGQLVAVAEPAYASYSTLPIAPSNSSAQGLLVLYALYQLLNANTPAGTELADALWLHYRRAFSEQAGTQFVQLQNDLRALDGRFTRFAWARMLKASDVVASAGQPGGTFARQAAAIDSLRKETVFADTPKWLQWIPGEQTLTPISLAIGEPRSLAVRLSTLRITSEDEHDGDTETALDRVYNELLAIASAEPRDLAELINLRVVPSASLVAGGASDAAQWLVPPAVSRDVAAVTGSEVAELGSTVLQRLLHSYGALVKAAEGDDKNTRTQRLRSAQLYVFLYVWLPLRTGIGFDQQLGVFRTRPISTSLVGLTGLLPLVGTQLYASESAIGGNPMTFSLGRELLEFWKAFVRPAGPDVSLPETVRDFLRFAPPKAVRSWGTTVHASASKFVRRELPLLGALFRAALFHAQQSALRIATTDDAPFFRVLITATGWQQAPASLPVEQRTPINALALFQCAAERVDAPAADVIYPTMNHAEFGAPAMHRLMTVLLNNPSREHMLLLVVGPALGRLPATLAYCLPWLHCVCIQPCALSNTAASGVRARATDWVTPTVDQMALISGDESLRRRVVMLQDFTLSQNSSDGVRLGRNALDKISEPVTNVFVLGNAHNAAVQFDVPMEVFASQFSKLVNTIAAHPTLRIVGQLSTVPTGGSRESAIAMSPAALPLGPLLARYRISNDRVYYIGSLPIAQVAATARSAESDRTRRAVLRVMSNTGGGNPLYAEMRDTVSDARQLLEGATLSPQIATLFTQQMFRLAVMAGAVEKMRGEGLLTTVPPSDVVQSMQLLLFEARQLRTIDQTALDAVERVISQPSGSILGAPTSSLLGAMLRALRGTLDAQSGDLPLLPVSLQPQGDDPAAHIVFSGALAPVKIALDRLDRAVMAQDNRRCLDVLAVWSRSLFDLASAAIQDYRDQFFRYSASKDSSAALESAQQAQIDRWTEMVSCLAELVSSGDSDVDENNSSLQAAYGPALIYAHMINTTLLATQRIVEAFHTDLRAQRAVKFSQQEQPFLAWFGLQARAEQQVVARLAALLFAENGWMLPTTVAVTRDGRTGYVVLREMASLAARQCARLLMSATYWNEYQTTLNQRYTEIKARGAMRARRGKSVSADDQRELDEAAARITRELNQYERVTDAFRSLAELFRAQSDAARLPIQFMIEESAEFVSDLQGIESQLLEQLRLAVSSIQDRVARESRDSQMQAHEAVLLNLEEMFVQLAYAYVSGGYQALFAALSGTTLRRQVMSSVQEEALRTEDVWRLPMNFESNSPELALAFPGDDRDREALVSWLRLTERGEAPVRTLTLPVRNDVVAVQEVSVDDQHQSVQQISLVLLPSGANQAPSAEQMSWMKTYLAAERLRVMNATARDVTALGENRQRVFEVLNRRAEISEATIGALRQYWAAVLNDPRVRKSRDPSSIQALSVQSDDYWLMRALENEPNEQPLQLPRFVMLQLSGDSLADKAKSNAFDNPSLLLRFLYAAYNALGDTKQNTAEYARWRALLLTDVPEFGPQLESESWRMSPTHLREAVQTSAEDEAALLAAAPAEVATNSVFRNLLIATILWSEEDVDPLLVKDDYLLKEATQQDTAALLQFARAYYTKPEQARAWWTDMLERRESAKSVDRRDVYEPDDARILDSFITRTLFAAIPEQERRLLHQDETGNLEAVAVLVRMIKYAREPTTEQSYRNSLSTELEAVLTRAQDAAIQMGVMKAVSRGTVQTVPLETIRANGQFIGEFNQFVQERLAIATEQRNIWRTALGRLLATVRSAAVPRTIAWWVRARGASWSQRLRMLNPAESTNQMWPAVLLSIDSQLGQFDIKEEVITNSALLLDAKRVASKWTRYEDEPLRNALTRQNYAADLLATALAGLQNASTPQIAAAYARNLMGSGGVPMILNRILLADAEKVKDFLRFEARKQSEEERALEEDRGEGTTGEEALMMFSGRFVDPVLRFRNNVLDDDDVAALSQSLASRLDPQRAEEAALLARTIGWYTRHVQFADAERNRAAPRVTARDKTSLRAFVDEVSAENAAPGTVTQLFARRMLNDSLLYADLDSLKSQEQIERARAKNKPDVQAMDE